MVRWQPGARGRLQLAALDLFDELGYDRTTVAAIAARAEVNERTFYRYFADKRGVLFTGTEDLAGLFRTAIADAPAASAPLDVTADTLRALVELFSAERRDWSRRRQAAIDTHAELRERELLKLAALADVATEGFGERGLEDLAARVAGETMVAMFKAAFAAWVAAGETRSFPQLVDTTVQGLREFGVAARS